jgi:hypothetical protein
MSSGTLISDLEGAPQIDGDGDLIKKIMADMNSEPQATPAPTVISSPNPNSTFHRAVDSGPATAHVIGHEHPTAGDFQASLEPRGLPPSGSYGNMASWSPQTAPPPPSPPMKKAWSARIAEEIKIPLFVSLLVFIFSLPFINIIIGTYLPSMVKATGDLTTLGLVLKSTSAGLTFWLLQRVIVPLLSL